jgi:hypothetical protein
MCVKFTHLPNLAPFGLFSKYTYMCAKHTLDVCLTHLKVCKKDISGCAKQPIKTHAILMCVKHLQACFKI